MIVRRHIAKISIGKQRTPACARYRTRCNKHTNRYKYNNKTANGNTISNISRKRALFICVCCPRSFLFHNIVLNVLCARRSCCKPACRKQHAHLGKIGSINLGYVPNNRGIRKRNCSIKWSMCPRMYIATRLHTVVLCNWKSKRAGNIVRRFIPAIRHKFPVQHRCIRIPLCKVLQRIAHNKGF